MAAARMRDVMDCGFWDFNVSSAKLLEGIARAVPGCGPPPVSGSKAPRTSRVQQLDVLAGGFPLGLLPFVSPPADKALGPFGIQTVVTGPDISENWWVGFVGQFRPWKLITSIKNEFTNGDEIEIPDVRDVAKHFLDKSLFALGLFSQFALTNDTSLLLNVERNGQRKGRRLKALLHHKLPNHDFTIEAASPELFLDENGMYWDVPLSATVDLSSLVSKSGLRYRVALHNNYGKAGAHSTSSDEAPSALQPGLCAKAAFSYEKSRDFWREHEEKQGKTSSKWTSDRFVLSPSYDIRLKEPHSAISGIIGGMCALWFGGDGSPGNNSKVQAGDGQATDFVRMTSKRSRFNVDLFGSLCYSFQKGKFEKDFNDLSRLDFRLDISSASAFINGAYHLISGGLRKGPVEREVNSLAAPRLNMTLQQQVIGPISVRLDARVSPTSPSGKHSPSVEDIIYSLSYSFRMLQSGKVMAWYSPKRNEAMIELRVYEF